MISDCRILPRTPPQRENPLQIFQLACPNFFSDVAEAESTQVAQMAGQPAGQRLRREGPGGRCVEQGQERDFLPDRAQLLGHLERDDPPERQAAQEIRPLRLQSPNLLDIRGGQVLHPRVVVRNLGDKSINRLLFAEVVDQRVVDADPLAKE